MSVIYDQLKQVEQTQVEAVAPVVEAEKSLPLEEEIQYQKQEKWYDLKGNLVKGGGVLLTLLIVIGGSVFISSRETDVPRDSAVMPSTLVSSPQRAAKLPATKPVVREMAKSTLIPQRAMLPPKATVSPQVIAFQKALAPQKAYKVALVDPKTLRSAQQVLASQDGKPVLPEDGVEAASLLKISPEMLAKAKKSLPPIQAGQHFYQIGALDKASKAYKKAVEEDPKQLEAYNNLGVIYTRKGWFKTAKKNFRAALKVNPYYAEAHYNLAVLLEKKGNNKQAFGHYLKFVEYARPKYKEIVKKVRDHIHFN